MKIQMPQKVSYIIETLIQHGFDAYAVGGCVRDSILKRNPDDWDITTSALPKQVKEIFERTIDTGIQHGTVTVLLERETFEVTTYRIDGEYEDMRHPKEVVFTGELREDLRRRDFTINAMAYNDRTGLVDIFGGMDDLQAKTIRCVGCARERFEEDALRVLRGIRFAAQLGFEIEAETKQAMTALAGNLAHVSAERIQVELMKLLLSPHPERIREAWELGITKVILPEFDRMMETQQHNPHHFCSVGEHTLKALTSIESQKALRLAVLFHDVGKPDTESIDEDGITHFYEHAGQSEKMVRKILRRLKFDNDTLYKVMRLVKWHDYRFTMQMPAIRKSIYQIGDDIFEDLLKVMRADVLAQSSYMQEEKLEDLQRIYRMYVQIKSSGQCLSLKDLAINGRDLIQAGVQPGEKIGRILNELLQMVLENPELNEKLLLLEKAKSLF